MIVMGLPGTGKSTLASALAARLELPVLRTDEVREEMALRGQYDLDSRRLVYREVESRLLSTLQMKGPVILDATFSEPVWQVEMQQLLVRHGIHPIWIMCTASDEVIQERLAMKRELSDADEATHRHLAQSFMPPDVPHTVVDTSVKKVEELVELVLFWIGRIPEINAPHHP